MFCKHIATSLIALLPTALLCGQVTPPSPQPQTGTAQADAKNNRGNAANDAILVSWLLIGNSNEIALARVAQQKAQSNEVKQFAQKMIDEHGQFAQKLQSFGGNAADPAAKPSGSDTGSERGGSERGSAGENRGTGREATATTGKTAGSAAQQSGTGAMDHAGIIRDLGKKCLESETKMLNEKSGADFDRCYMTMVVGAHVKSADMLEVFGTYASERLRPALEAGHKTTVAHLEHAKTLCQQTEVGTKQNEKGEKIGSQGGR